ncbi:MAG: membrane-bound lytic murein transglycosylase D [Gammaproteobacteria bacterium]|jgi:membrane-bound lytic murein transglycosylase D
MPGSEKNRESWSAAFAIALLSFSLFGCNFSQLITPTWARDGEVNSSPGQMQDTADREGSSTTLAEYDSAGADSYASSANPTRSRNDNDPSSMAPNEPIAPQSVALVQPPKGPLSATDAQLPGADKALGNAPGRAATSSLSAPSASPVGPWPETVSLWSFLNVRMELHGALPKTHTRQRKWVRANPVWISEIMQRSTDYLPFIARAIDERGLPAELALIPAVESGFEASAQSQGGAEGLWQFMPNTARGYGLKRTWWYEGRRDTIAATDAALRYLAALNKRFKGNWLLAIAAYNCGAGTVSRALRRSGLNAENAQIWDILKELPKETQKYVPRVLAMAEVVQDPARFGLELPPANMSPRFAAVDTGGQIDLQRVASLAKIDLDVLSELNPAYRRWATDPAGPHRLLVPPHLADEVQALLAQLEPNQRVSWRRHKVRRGESLSVLAKRYGVRVSVLKTANKLKSTRIRAGANLLIPRAKRIAPHGPQTKARDLQQK